MKFFFPAFKTLTLKTSKKSCRLGLETTPGLPTTLMREIITLNPIINK
jgi:hypothetical protein